MFQSIRVSSGLMALLVLLVAFPAFADQRADVEAVPEVEQEAVPMSSEASSALAIDGEREASPLAFLLPVPPPYCYEGQPCQSRYDCGHQHPFSPDISYGSCQWWGCICP